MQDARIAEKIRDKSVELLDDLNERGQRCWAAVEARGPGRGGITAVAAATGLSDRTIRNGRKELDTPVSPSVGRQRREGGGRKSHAAMQPGLRNALDRMIDPTARGSPANPLRWTIKSTRRLAEELRKQGCEVGASSVRRMLSEMGYSLRGNRKALEGDQHADRDAQFRHIAGRVRARKRRNEPALSVDAKEKEVLGNRKNSGRAYRPEGAPLRVETHDFPDPELGKAVPYGVYDTHENEAGVSVGISRDTAEFAVGAIRRWWEKRGRARYRNAKRIVVTADSGGSSSSRCRLWKVELRKFADETGMAVEVCHYPPGTSKWNEIEHRLSCRITGNWRGTPLESPEVVVQSVGRTTTKTGLEVHAWLDEGTYEKGRKISGDELAECNIKRNKFHGEWN